MNRPMSFQVHLTDACNRRCLHCYQDFDNRTNLDSEKFDYILYESLSHIASMGGYPLRAIFCGGEPTLSPILLESCQKCQEAGIERIAVLTNGTLITDEYAREMVKAGVTDVQICIEGKKDTHNMVRDGTWDQVLRAWDICAKNGLIVKNQTTITALNYQEVDEIIDTCKGKVLMTSFLKQVPHDNRIEFLKPSQWLEVLARIFYGYLHYGSDYSDFVRVRDIHWAQIFGVTEYRCGLIQENYPGPIVESNGDVYACRRGNIVIGNIFKESLSNIYSNNEIFKKVKQFRKKEGINASCGKCTDFTQCGGGCRAMALAVNGDLMAEDPQCLHNEVDENFWIDLLKSEKYYSMPTAVEAEDEITIETTEVVNFMKITGIFESALKEVVRRKITSRAACEKGISVSAEELQDFADTFRTTHGLHRGSDTVRWLKENDISLESFESFMEEELLNRKFKAAIENEVGQETLLKESEIKELVKESIYDQWLQNEVNIVGGL